MDTSNIHLIEKTCTPCNGEASALSQEVAHRLFIELNNDWVLNNTTHLYKEYKFKNFIGAMHFANQIAALAQAEAHHPNLMIAWGVCAVEIWTHKIDGLTENDFILAAKIDLLFK
ncbi:4a-hydroxytetrahydrobiopterin dehydratase [Candidatus Tisiphia endosymbiont of Nemotelus uliginosus]|uniref:4a-hydroxytetrahydrobiopterin dehydratase n=1 Tax=Candidatus Tisiphia endosymbiont of Nemotelus uliginosus TaxID=3077926 RepID=UPI0035C8AB60